MKYLLIKDIAKKWNLSERSIRNYCIENRIPNAYKKGKEWLIPEDAVKPIRKKRTSKNVSDLLTHLKEEKELNLSGSIYHKLQIEMTYNSNHIEGSKLTYDQTRYIFETNTIGISEELNVDDIVETINHFRCIDYVIDHAKDKLSESFIKQLHSILKTGTSDTKKNWFAVGDYKKMNNEVGGQETTKVENVSKEIKILLNEYSTIKNKNINDLISFHYQFEKIHPFQDGNGRIGRLILLKECLNNNITPFIITDSNKLFYYRGLKEWKYEKGYLVETCLLAQDNFKKYLDYFGIKYID